LIPEPGAVGIAVYGKPDVRALLRYAREELVDVRRDGLGVHAAEVRIALAVKLDDPCLAAAEESRKVSGRAPEERLADDRVAGATERVQVEELGDAREVVRRRIEHLHQPSALRVVELHPLHVLRPRLEGADDRLELLEHRRRSGRAGLLFYFEAVVRPGIVARGD